MIKRQKFLEGGIIDVNNLLHGGVSRSRLELSLSFSGVLQVARLCLWYSTVQVMLLNFGPFVVISTTWTATALQTSATRIFPLKLILSMRRFEKVYRWKIHFLGLLCSCSKCKFEYATANFPTIARSFHCFFRFDIANVLERKCSYILGLFLAVSLTSCQSDRERFSKSPPPPCTHTHTHTHPPSLTFLRSPQFSPGRTSKTRISRWNACYAGQTIVRGLSFSVIVNNVSPRISRIHGAIQPNRSTKLSGDGRPKSLLSFPFVSMKTFL